MLLISATAEITFGVHTITYFMRWIRVLDKLPAENQEVLLRCRTVVYLAVFDPERNRFLLKDGTVHDATREDLHWSELSGPVQPPFTKNA